MDKPYEFIPLLGKKDYKKKDELYKGKIKLQIKLVPKLISNKETIFYNSNLKALKMN